MKKIIIIALLAGLVYLGHRANPDFDAHKQRIAPDVPVASEVWNTLQYDDYYLISFTSTTERGTMVSMGAATWVGLMDKEWAPGNP